MYLSLSGMGASALIVARMGFHRFYLDFRNINFEIFVRYSAKRLMYTVSIAEGTRYASNVDRDGPSCYLIGQILFKVFL